MNIIVILLQAVGIIVIPLLVIRAKDRKLIRTFGPVSICYGLGFLIAIIIFVVNRFGVEFSLNQDVGEIGSHAAIGIAIPLLLFSTNLGEVKKLSKTVLVSFMTLTGSVIVVCIAVFFFYAKNVINGAELSAMAAGLYTGGTPNLVAIGSSLGLDRTMLATANAADMVFGAIFYIFLLTLSKPLLSKILHPMRMEQYLKAESNIENYEEFHGRLRQYKELSSTVLLSLLIVVIGAILGVGYWSFFGNGLKLTEVLVPFIMITATILGIVFSFVPKVRAVKGNNIMGQYLVLVFSFALASSVNIESLSTNFGSVLLLFSLITVGVFVVHVILSKLFHLDVDCTIITLTAGVYGPAFIPAVSESIKNEKLVAPGLICGSLGYAIGTFLGLLLYTLF